MFCVFMSGGHSTNLIINRKLSARLHKHAVMPSKIFVCTCEQCRFVKNKRKNRKLKKKIKRLMNKKLRKGKDGKVFNFYWA